MQQPIFRKTDLVDILSGAFAGLNFVQVMRHTSHRHIQMKDLVVIHVDVFGYDPSESYENSPVQAVTSGNSEAVKLGCVQVNFPFSLQLENGQTLTVTTYAEFEAAVSSSEPVALDFEYPVEGVNHLGIGQTFNDALSLGRSFATCVPDKGWGRSQSSGTTLPAFLMTEYCMDLDYPASLVDGQGNTYTAANELDFVKHSLAHADLFFTLPLTVRYNQASSDITSLDKMFDAFSMCSESNYMPLQEGADGRGAILVCTLLWFSA